MDFSPLLALGLAFGSILLGNYLEGGHIDSLIQVTAGLIVFGGTLGATWLAATPQELRRLRVLTFQVLKPQLADRKKLLEDILRITAVARRDGMLAVESHLASVDDEMMRRGLQMLVDGYAGEDVKNVLEIEVDMEEHHDGQAAKVLETAGGFAPTVGILGAVLGLIHVMQNLSEPEKLGTGIAVAFVATVYGVGSANLVFIPLGNRLKKIAQARAEDRQMVIAGLGTIVAGANARQVTEMLAAYTGTHDVPGDKPAGGGDREAA